jgi:DNA (cytosine-5)-methyltransferase 1
VGGKQSPIDDRRNWDGYIIKPNGESRKKVVRLTPEQGLQLQGFPTRGNKSKGVRRFKFPEGMSHADCMKQLGNSVAVPAIEDYARAIFEALNSLESGN